MKAHHAIWKAITVNTTTTPAGKEELKEAVSQGPAHGKGKSKATRGLLDGFLARDISIERNCANRNFTIWSAVNLTSQNIINDIGVKLFVGNFAPSYFTETTHKDTFNKILSGLYNESKDSGHAESVKTPINTVS